MLLNQNAKDQLGKLVLSVQLESTSIEVDYFDIKAVLKSAGGGGGGSIMLFLDGR